MHAYLRHSLTAVAALVLGGTVQMAGGSEMTAFELIKEGNRYVGEESKDKVVQIRSEKSVGSLTPIISTRSAIFLV